MSWNWPSWVGAIRSPLAQHQLAPSHFPASSLVAWRKIYRYKREQGMKSRVWRKKKGGGGGGGGQASKKCRLNTEKRTRDGDNGAARILWEPPPKSRRSPEWWSRWFTIFRTMALICQHCWGRGLAGDLGPYRKPLCNFEERNWTPHRSTCTISRRCSAPSQLTTSNNEIFSLQLISQGCCCFFGSFKTRKQASKVIFKITFKVLASPHYMPY